MVSVQPSNVPTCPDCGRPMCLRSPIDGGPDRYECTQCWGDYDPEPPREAA